MSVRCLALPAFHPDQYRPLINDRFLKIHAPETRAALSQLGLDAGTVVPQIQEPDPGETPKRSYVAVSENFTRHGSGGSGAFAISKVC